MPLNQLLFHTGTNPAFITAADGNLADFSIGTIQGTIDKVVIKSRAAGSLFILASGTREPLVNLLVPSGTVAQTYYPKAQIVSNLTTAAIGNGSGNIWTGVLANDNAIMCGSGMTSGTIAEITYVKIYYRS